MQIDALSLSLSPSEISDILMGLHLPEGIRIDDVSLTDDGLEITVKPSFLLGLPLRFRVQVQSFAGSRVSLKVVPPIKPHWLVVRPLISSLPGAMYAGHSVIEADLVAMSKGYLSSITIRKIVLNRSGLHIETSSIRSKVSWDEILRIVPW